MTPGTQSPFFLLLLLTVLTATTAPKPATVVTGSGHASSTPGGEKETSATQRSSVPSSTEKNAIYKQGGFLGLSNIKFRPGSVVVQLTLAFREGTINVHDVETQFNQYKTEAASRYNLTISDVSVSDVPFPFSAQSGAGVPGWGIALLVLVCVLVALAIVYLIALAVCQCRRKNYGQLDIFPARDTYHPMSEYPTYHTHGRYVPPSSTDRSPYEKVSAGNGGSSLSYTNPAVAATSANL
ncbi:mucin-1 isoform 13 precursor [Homo sapiens]|uniref:Mucin-1 n=1 Tax=Homo sapiens TaxID=9606 RepID=A5YRV0_HUMAN|nr:mucin-1 isoform 13 precursor [Homo sapiens]ABQ59627.1 MUC1 isoform G-LSP [Homo sapiens]|eukprot:NP_001191218.1 mucin-1 isoform 13 precursor [Homo sapiens]